MDRPDLLALRPDALAALVASLGEPSFRARQIGRWLHEKGATSFDEMSNLPKALRERLAERFEIGAPVEVRRQRATDRTVKSLFRLPSGRHVEAVLIPDFDDDGAPRRMTVCISSQVGCAMACSFCATGLMGFQENLSAGQIVAQARHMHEVALAEFGRGVSNVVYMGMGEPFQNFSAVMESTALIQRALDVAAKRITVSTVGLARRIRDFADATTGDDGPGPVGLAISLHAPTDAQRSAIMPVNRSAKTDLKQLGQSVRYYYQKTGRKVTYEYCLFDGVNDSVEDARNLARVASWAPCKVNLIMYNPVEGTDFRSPGEARLDAFIGELVRRRVRVTVRRSRGQDIDAACGQLAVAEGA